MRTIFIEQSQTPEAPSQSSVSGSGKNGAEGTFGLWAKVIARHSDDHTVDIMTDRGLKASRIPVASQAWVYTGNGKTGGKRNLPPVDSYVFVLMPEGQLESGFVLCSGFPRRMDQDVKKDFLVAGKESESLGILPGGLTTKYDESSGDLQINTVHGHTIKLNGSGINVTDYFGNEVQLEATGVTIKTIKGKITGGIFELNGTAAPGAGPFCSIPVCPFTGVVHTGSQVVGT